MVSMQHRITTHHGATIPHQQENIQRLLTQHRLITHRPEEAATQRLIITHRPNIQLLTTILLLLAQITQHQPTQLPLFTRHLNITLHTQEADTQHPFITLRPFTQLLLITHLRRAQLTRAQAITHLRPDIRRQITTHPALILHHQHTLLLRPIQRLLVVVSNLEMLLFVTIPLRLAIQRRLTTRRHRIQHLITIRLIQHPITIRLQRDPTIQRQAILLLTLLQTIRLLRILLQAITRLAELTLRLTILRGAVTRHQPVIILIHRLLHIPAHIHRQILSMGIRHQVQDTHIRVRGHLIIILHLVSAIILIQPQEEFTLIQRRAQVTLIQHQALITIQRLVRAMRRHHILTQHQVQDIHIRRLVAEVTPIQHQAVITILRHRVAMEPLHMELLRKAIQLLRMALHLTERLNTLRHHTVLRHMRHRLILIQLRSRV